MKLRDEQVKAIETIDKNVIINAGAGTGKTEVLTRRYVHLLKNGVFTKDQEVSSIVAITFTKKAAQEMKQRVKNLVNESNDPYLKSLLGDLNNPNISTIDSFCGKLVRENSYHLNIDPNFSIMDEKESDELFNRTLNQLLDDEKYSGIIFKILNVTGKRQADQIRSDISSVYKQVCESVEDTNFYKDLIYNKTSEFNRFSKRQEIYEELIKLNEERKLSKKLEEFLFQDRNIDYLLKEDYNAFMGLVSIMNSLKAEKYDYVKSLIDLEYQFLECKHLDLNILLLDLFNELDGRIFTEKKSLGRFDFTDVLKMALKLLEIPTVKNKIQEQIKYLMVDEYQDSNDMQKELFYKICSQDDILDRDNLFVVGDPKQSIYGFRGANINVFNETLEDILESGGELIDFRMNFRSDKDIIEPINNIYSQVMGDRYTPLNYSKDSGKSKFLIIDGDKNDGKEQEVDLTSRFILNSLKSKECNLKDFTLLFRMRSGMKEFEESFKNYKLPYYTFDSPGFFITEEINLIRAILKLYKNPSNTSSYYIILNSRIYGHTDVQILEAIKSSSKALENSQNDIYSKIIELRQRRFYSNFELLNEIYRKFKILEAWNYEKKDYQGQGNLYMMLKIAQESDKNNENFDEFFYTLEDKYSTLNQQQVEDEQSKVIKLMTIHGAKGLGFNRVILPQMSKMTPSDKSLINFTKVYGVGINLFGNGFIFNKNKDIKRKHDEVEDDNIYYVAMTRAKEDLVLGVAGRNSGYKKVIYPIIKENYLNNFIKEEDYLNISYLESEEYKGDYSMDFDYIKDLKSSKTSIRNLNISLIMENYNRENSIPRIYDSNLKDNQSNISEVELGSIIHRFAQIYNGEFELTLSRVMEEFLIDDDNFEFITSLLQSILEKLPKEYFLARREMNFIYRVKNCIFRGIIDNIQEFDDTIIITDYKYSALNNRSLIENYWIQLVFYGMVVQGAYKDKKIELQLINLRNSFKTKIDFNEEKKRFLKEIIIDYVDGGKIGRKDTIG
ncbi:UvrD-helicase domain-containing protein [Lagierella sp.]|uniref:UvrD-helicase domain-containing protein n=1 Tax=Lagierella sp. TaxID=2849657 RepID=UPI00261BB12F|nr:UvrD-helicase domain-containing protein [Lagierella sp.]